MTGQISTCFIGCTAGVECSQFDGIVLICPTDYKCVCRVITLVMTAQIMSFRCELACKGHSTEKAQDLAT